MKNFYENEKGFNEIKIRENDIFFHYFTTCIEFKMKLTISLKISYFTN
jgi:hypothetical protein